MSDLRDRGFDAELLVPEDDDISLAERVRRINAACFLLGTWSASMSTPPETAPNGSIRPDGASIPVRGRQRLISSLNAFAWLLSRIS